MEAQVENLHKKEHILQKKSSSWKVPPEAPTVMLRVVSASQALEKVVFLQRALTFNFLNKSTCPCSRNQIDKLQKQEIVKNNPVNGALKFKSSRNQ